MLCLLDSSSTQDPPLCFVCLHCVSALAGGFALEMPRDDRHLQNRKLLELGLDILDGAQSNFTLVNAAPGVPPVSFSEPCLPAPDLRRSQSAC